MSTLLEMNQRQNLNAITALSKQLDGEFIGQYQGHEIHSYYQPIYSVSGRKILGHEGLMRAFYQGKSISPWEMVQPGLVREECVALDRLCRYLHISNFQYIHEDGGMLFLNVSPNVIVYGRNYGSFFSELLEEVGLDASRIVIEVLEKSVDDLTQLERSLDYYRRLGCQIAIDDFGTGDSDFDRLECIQPDIIKLDKAFLHHFMNNNNQQLDQLFDISDRIGAELLQEGIEEPQQLKHVAIHQEVKWVQGFLFAEPQPLHREVLFNQGSFVPRLVG